MTSVTFLDGPRNGSIEDVDGPLPAVIGDGSDGGVYQQTDAVDGVARVYRWWPLTEGEANAIVRGDLRANQL